MKVKMESSRAVKPCYGGVVPTPATLTTIIPLSPFDKVTFDTHIAVIYVYRAPTPPNALLEKGLTTALSEYRELAGRLRKDAGGKPAAILLNDAGARFVEACVDGTLDRAMPLRPSPSLLRLHPDLHGPEELFQVQLTRFTCGSLAVGLTAHHSVADGHAVGCFLVAWGRATRGLRIPDVVIDDPPPAPPHVVDRSSFFFTPRDPPQVEFEHRGAEFTAAPILLIPKKTVNAVDDGEEDVRELGADREEEEEEVVVHKTHFTVEFLARVKASAAGRGTCNNNNNKGRPYTTFECLVAHLWRVTTGARGLGGHETTQVRISVNGRSRLSPRVPAEYFGNLVLWAFPRAKVKELLARPLAHAAGLIRDAVAGVNGAYFQSFVDFACSGAVEEEGLVPTASMGKPALCPNVEVDSWLRLPFYELDFGGGTPYIFMPSYFPVEGMMFLLPSFLGDGSVDAFVPLFRRNLPEFKKLCYSLDADVPGLIN